MKPNSTNGIMLLCDSETLANRIRGLMQVRWQGKVRVDYDAPFVHVSWLPEASDFKESITTRRIKEWLSAIINKQITVINFQHHQLGTNIKQDIRYYALSSQIQKSMNHLDLA